MLRMHVKMCALHPTVTTKLGGNVKRLYRHVREVSPHASPRSYKLIFWDKRDEARRRSY